MSPPWKSESLPPDIERRNRDMLAINQIHQSLFACESAADVATVLTTALVRDFEAFFARVWLVRPADRCEQCALKDHCPEKRECLHLVASHGHYTHIDGDHGRVPIGCNFKIGLIAQGRGKTISNDVTNDERVHDREWAGRLGLKSFAGFPLIRNGRIIGVMAMFSKQILPERLLDTLELLTELGVSALTFVEKNEGLRRSERQLALTLDATSDGIWDWNLESDMVTFSPHWPLSLGYDVTEVPPDFDSWRRMVHPDDLKRFDDEMKKHVEGRCEHFECESRLRMRSEDYRWTLDRGKVVERNHAGQAVRVVGSSRDITHRKRAETELAKMNRELHDISRQSGMAEAATSVLHSVGNVLNSVNVSAGVLEQTLGRSTVSGLSKTVEIIPENAEEAHAFFACEGRGKHL